MYKILIIEDDMVIAEQLSEQLRRWNYEACCVTNFMAVTEQFLAFDPHLILLDISLPAYNGYYWCTEIRKCSKVPIIFISSADDNMNIVMAINMGGDDFVAKPFDTTVLTAKIQALLRRTYSFQGQMNVLEYGGAILNLNDATLTYGHLKIDLTKNEFRILQLLLENAGKAVSREALMTRLWESDSFVDDNTLTVNVTRLRRKLEEAGLRGWIRTKKGFGYLAAGGENRGVQ